MMGEGNRVASVILFTCTLKPGTHAHTGEASSGSDWLAGATNPNSTPHNGSEHRRDCLLPSPIIISLLPTQEEVLLRDCKTANFAKVRFQLYWTAWQAGESSLLDCAELICRTLSGAGLGWAGLGWRGHLTMFTK